MVVEETTLTLAYLSDVGKNNDIPLGGNGAQVLRTEDVYPDDSDCNLGDPIGTVYIVETDTGRRSRVLVTATFDLDNGESFTLHGIAERVEHNGRPSFRGQLSIGGGVGTFRGRRGQVDVDVCNPKRWIITSP